VVISNGPEVTRPAKTISGVREVKFEESLRDTVTCETVEGICSINRVKHKMTVEGYVGGTPIQFLVDTGASCTLISETAYRKICSGEEGNLRKLSDRKLRLADGTPLHTRGILNMEIQLGPVAVNHEVIVANVSDEGIIGYDFLLTHGCKIDVSKHEFSLRGRRISCNPENIQGPVSRKIDSNCINLKSSHECVNCLTHADGTETSVTNDAEEPSQLAGISPGGGMGILRVKNTLEIHPEIEQLIEVTLDGNVHGMNTEVLVKPLQKFENRYKLKVAASLLNLKSDQPIVRVLNPNRHSVELLKNTEIAKTENILDKCYEAEAQEDRSTTELCLRQIGDYGSHSPGPGESLRQKSAAEKKYNGEERVISYASRAQTKPERNYSVPRKEPLAVDPFVKHYRHFLIGRKFLIRSNHRPIQWDSLILRNGLRGQTPNEFRPVLPQEMHEEALKASHDGIPGDHVGEKKIYRRGTAKVKKKEESPLSMILVASPMDCISTGSLGPLPVRSKGNDTLKRFIAQADRPLVDRLHRTLF